LTNFKAVSARDENFAMPIMMKRFEQIDESIARHLSRLAIGRLHGDASAGGQN
jgi:hypothetical protein